jgi:hypothetical protein
MESRSKSMYQGYLVLRNGLIFKNTLRTSIQPILIIHMDEEELMRQVNINVQ